MDNKFLKNETFNFHQCWSVKKLMKENKKLKKSAEKDRKEREKSDKSLDNIENGRTTDSDESENEDDDEDAGKVAQLLISTDNDVESRNYTPGKCCLISFISYELY